MPKFGFKHSDETKRKISLAKKGILCSSAHKKRMSEGRKGMKLTEEHKRNIGKGNKGKKRSEETRIKISKANTGKKNWNWKGKQAGSCAMHEWIERNKGKASKYKCEHCNKQAKHWANKKHDYKRNLDDYMALCISCHWIFDYKYNNRTRKGRKT